MVQTDIESANAARKLAATMFPQGVTANLNLDDIKAAVVSIDTAMDIVIRTIPGPWQTKPIKEALIDNLPEPFQTNSTATQKAQALNAWAVVESAR